LENVAVERRLDARDRVVQRTEGAQELGDCSTCGAVAQKRRSQRDRKRARQRRIAGPCDDVDENSNPAERLGPEPDASRSSQTSIRKVPSLRAALAVTNESPRKSEMRAPGTTGVRRPSNSIR